MALTLVKGNIIEDGAVTGANIATGAVTSADIQDSTIISADMAVDPQNASNLNAGDVPSAQLGNVPLTSLQNDIAVVSFKISANGSLSKYNLVDQFSDTFQDAAGVDASASTNATRDSAKYYSGTTPASGGTVTTYGAYQVHSFLTTGNTNFVAAGSDNVDVLVVAGGGGGGSFSGGGGGAEGARWGEHPSPLASPAAGAGGGLCV